MSYLTVPTELRTRRILAWVILVAVALVVLLFHLGEYRTLGSHEALAAVPAREMAATGDWLVPRYATVPRLQKPPLVYWLIATNNWLFGSADEFTARLHSALAALSLMALMSFWAARWYGREAAFGAGLIQACSVWVLNFGRHAAIDMVLCLIISGMLFLIATQPEDEPSRERRSRWLLIYSLFGLSWLAKFYYGAGMVLGPTFVFWAMQRRWDRFRNLWNPVGLFVAASCVFMWPWLVWNELPEALSIWRLETVGRAMGELGHDPWWFYLPSFAVMTMPWLGIFVLAAPSSLSRAWQQNDERERFLWTWLLVDLGLVWQSPDKHDNYLLAALPACTLLACQAWARIAARMRRGVLRMPKFLPFVGMAAVLGLGLWLFVHAAPQWPEAQWAVSGVSVCLICTQIPACWFLYRRRWPAAGWTALAGALGGYLLIVGSIMKVSDHRLPNTDFARQLRREVLGDECVCVYQVGRLRPLPDPVAFYLGNPVCRASTPDELRRLVNERGELLAVIEQPNLATLDAIAEVETLRIMPSSPGDSDREIPLACVRLRTPDRLDRGVTR